MAEKDKIKLSKKAIDLLPLPQRAPVDYHFVDKPGLVIRVMAGGAKTFYVLKRRSGGGMVREKVGRYPDITPEQAARRAAELLAELAMGNDPTQARRELRGSLSVQQAFDQFIELKRNKKGVPLSPKTKEEYTRCLRLYWSAIAKKKLPEVTQDEVARQYRKIGLKHPTTANRARAMLASLFNWCIENKMVDTNPVASIKKAYADVERERFLSGDELRRFFEALDNVTPDMRDFFLLSLLTGARRSNVQAMAWTELDLQAHEWLIARTKNGTSQIVTLSPEAFQILESRKQSAQLLASRSPFVFPGPGSTGHLVEPKKAWAKLLETAQIENLRLHDLRRTLGSWQTKTGASMAIVGKSLNHKSIQSTKIYARLDLDPVRESVNRATDAMLHAAGVKQPDDNVVPIATGRKRS